MVDFLLKKEHFKEYYAANFVNIVSAEKAFRNLIFLLLSNSSDFTTPKVEGRIKERNECIEKFNLKYRKDVEKSKRNYEIRDFITDLIGLRVICHYESDIDKVVEILKQNFETIEITNKTSQLLEKHNAFGYKGVHLDLKLDKIRAKLPEYTAISEFQFEVQVRSIVQDAWSEVDHKLKYKKSLSEKLQRRVINLAALFELADREFDSIKLETILEIKENVKSEQILSKEKINAFNILNYLRSKFSDFTFEDYKIEGFVEEILSLKEITLADFVKAFDAHSECVEDYRKYRELNFGENMNPFTIIRHILYINNSRLFHTLLFDLQRNNFTHWVSENG